MNELDSKYCEVKLIQIHASLYTTLDQLAELTSLSWEWDNQKQLTLQSALQRCIRLSNQIASVTKLPMVSEQDYYDV